MQTHEQQVETVVQKVNKSSVPLLLDVGENRILLVESPAGVTRDEVLAALVRFDYPPTQTDIERVFGQTG